MEIYDKIFHRNQFLDLFKGFLTTLEQKQAQNLRVHIQKEQKILSLTDCFWLALVAFKWPENERAFCLKTFATEVITKKSENIINDEIEPEMIRFLTMLAHL